MICNALKSCKICGFKAKSNNSFCTHIKIKHNLNINEYIKTYLDRPFCKYCKTEKVGLYTRPFLAVYRNKVDRLWKEICSNPECINKYNKEIQANFYKNNEVAKELHRQQRINYLKKRMGKTAWERRAAGEMSYLEKWFFDECIQKYKLYNKYDIINEYSEYPYFIDFAFKNINLAVELDGKCHFIHGETRNGHDRKKDEYLNSKGWNVFRIGYTENNENTIKEFLNYISMLQTEEKTLTNRIFKYKEIKKEKKHKNLQDWRKEDYQRRLELNKPLIELVLNSNIDFSKHGWVNKVAILINKRYSKVNGWMKKYMPEFYKEKCFKRKLAGCEGTAPSSEESKSSMFLLHQQPNHY